MIWIILFVVLLAAIYLPSLWVRQVLAKYSKPPDRYRQQGTGADLARHLLKRFDMEKVAVEETEIGDHYDPQAKAVRLSPDNYAGTSLTAITVAAHEVGHAIQDAQGERLFKYRQRLVKTAIGGEKIGSLMLLGAPVIMMLLRLPQISFTMLLIGFGSMLLGTLVHLVTLPVELDASFNKALPILKEGNYLQQGDLPHAQRILKAAAFTYVAGSLASLLNLARWIAILRR